MKNTLWHYQREGRSQGPVSEEELLSLLAAGTLKPHDLVWHKGLSEWIEISHSPLTQSTSAPQPPALPPEAVSPLTGKTPPPFPKDTTRRWGIGCLIVILVTLLAAGLVVALAFWAYRSAQEEIHNLLKEPLPQEVPVPAVMTNSDGNTLKLPNQFPNEISGAEKEGVATEKPLPGTASHHTATYQMPSGDKATLHLIELHGDEFFSSFLASLRERKDIRAVWANETNEEDERKTFLFSGANQGLYLIREDEVLIMVSAPSPGDAEEIGEKLTTR